ncbi:hypothetical protein PFICI_13166 [Pestalotiopsis fici W106-1]|uniref:Chitin-binding type-1 domain-containing protein n=1 Tax=Pestalotiopsis fici (strain W106-1 / CGMCC3.15140) TaxID=1229662 RepID=W3WNG1_PESFW|nr:uncharacterized protein PFICI_13166 [Pestalotiopsis fici W106-1]ETS74682.1 hypothetical protein PFICI_13166 [Pestalotiopsis fici W106-1]
MKFSVLVWLVPALVASQSTTTSSLPAWATGVETEDGTCGGTTGWVCTPTWGACCSKDGICGRSDAYCGEGCQPLAGNCNAVAAPAPGPGSPSPDGSCGGANQYNCTGATYGACCSSSGYCGDTTGHCGAGCQSLFGTCSTVDDTVSTDGQCGSNGKTCEGSGFGDCCSSGGWCGGTDAHCGTGCQEGFGNCTSTGSNPPSGGISVDGACGANGKTCEGSTFGDCCSSSGYCGGTDAFCDAGCQSGFGLCSDAVNVTTDGTCGHDGKICTGSTFGNCCSANGYCGDSDSHCGTGCQQSFGKCSAPSNVTTDGTCGKNGKTCKGSTFGDCCSSSGYCGSTSDHCSVGCQSSFGTCDSGSANISTDGSCSKNGKTCKGSTFGDCCSASNYCGKTTDHCGTGCQSGFGTCTSTDNNISTDGACGKNGKTCKGSTFGDCCSSSGYCGKTTDHCGAGCNAAFGTCSSGSSNISTDGQCGSKNGKTCVESGFGGCCSLTGNCGSTGAHCGQGCQKDSSSACLTTNIPTNDGTCGAKVGLTCAGGSFDGNCCSSSGYCGTTTGHCGTGCQRGYGKCT